MESSLFRSGSFAEPGYGEEVLCLTIDSDHREEVGLAQQTLWQ